MITHCLPHTMLLQRLDSWVPFLAACIAIWATNISSGLYLVSGLGNLPPAVAYKRNQVKMTANVSFGMIPAST